MASARLSGLGAGGGAQRGGVLSAEGLGTALSSASSLAGRSKDGISHLRLMAVTLDAQPMSDLLISLGLAASVF
jgi:hypothetical protein